MPKIFVVMPFSPSLENIYENCIKVAFEESSFTITRADSDWHQHNILRSIIPGIIEADLIIADLTGLNSNVFYELGVAHALEQATD
ncbi:MAG: hypothetical protein L0154_23065, partial [Chloroflexi bacterium]|nr:hypothetical protein [Chloroflexota bacterium]